MKRLVEIRAYALKPGRAAAFDDVFVSRALPLLHESAIDVVAFGPSPHDADHWYLIRAFDDLADRDAREDAFYASSAWRDGPRASIVEAIDRYLDTLVWMSADAVDDLRRANAR